MPKDAPPGHDPHRPPNNPQDVPVNHGSSPDGSPAPQASATPSGDWPDVAVIITTYNRTEYLVETIDSVISQDYHGHIEIAVVDDGSTDDTPQVVQPYADRFADPSGRVTIRYIAKANEGLAIARNMGIANTSAPYIAFVDDDDICEPTKVRLQAQALRDDPEVGLVHTSFRYIDAQGDFSDDGPQRVDNPCVGRCVDALLNELMVISSTVMVRRSTIEQAATAEPHGLPYDPAWKRSQDYDMALRMARISPFAYIREPLLRYRFHENNIAMSKGNIKRAFGYHCRVQMDFVKRYGPEIGVDEANVKQRVAQFLFKRAESQFWQRQLDTARELCDLAKELGVWEARFDDLYRRASRPGWLYDLKDGLDRLRPGRQDPQQPMKHKS